MIVPREADALPTPAEREIRRRIAARGPMTFAEFMDLALYWPAGGYYTRGRSTTGPGGDFLTAPETSPAFGKILARQVAEVWERLGRPEAFELVEAGPGRGFLASDLMEGLAVEAPELRERIVLTLDEVDPARRDRQRERLAPLIPDGRLRWEETSLPRRPPRSWTGVLLANELLDALPVHRVVRRAGNLREWQVAEDASGRLVWCEGDPDDEVAAYATRFGAAPGEGDQAEVGLAACRWVEDAARSLRQGALIFVDYGFGATRLYDADHRRGTLLAYRRHQVEEDLLARVGRQDLTSHVNWTAVDEAAGRAGLDRLGRTTQDRFLLALGLGERFAALAVPAQQGDREALQEQAALKTLILPQGMGCRFQVSAYGRELEGELTGFADPLDPDHAPPPHPADPAVSPPRRKVRLVR